MSELLDGVILTTPGGIQGGMNDNEEDRVCALAECVSGDVVTHLDGSRWEVIHTPDKPSFFLKKVGERWQTGLDGPCLHVIPGGQFEEQFFCLGHYDPSADDGADGQ